MKKQLSLGLGLLLGAAASASVTNQYTFPASSLPSHAGNYNRSYYSENNAFVASMLVLATNLPSGPYPPGFATNGVPQNWDFSAPQQSSETILRTDIIAPTNGPDSGSFPAATYAEQDTQEPSTKIAWRYYSITNAGRYYYGFYEPQSVDADALVAFDEPTVDIPPNVKYGDTWSRMVTWGGNAENDPIDYTFTTTATVDAYGTLTLPSIGSVIALRVHEAQDYQGSYYGVLLEDAPCDYYYWLVPGLGVAVQIIVNQSDTSGTLSGVNFVERMFYANYFTNSNSILSSSVGNLHIQMTNGSIQLTWSVFTNSSSYQVEGNSSPTSTNWQILDLTSGTNWSETLSPTQRYYRVVGLP